MATSVRSAPQLAKPQALAQPAAVNEESLQHFAHSWISAWNRRDDEAILAHYADGVTFRSAREAASSELRGRPALADHIARSLQEPSRIPAELLHVLNGADAATLVCRAEGGGVMSETMVFDSAGRVRESRVTESAGQELPKPIEWRRDDYLLTDDSSRADMDAICALLHSTYWAHDRSREVIERGVRHSTCLHLLQGGRQVGLIRGVTDHATFTWVCDVIVDEAHRGRGLGKWLMKCFLEHPAVQTISHHLCTKDAHVLYEAFGFQRIEAMRRSDRPMPFLLKTPAD